MAVTVQMQFESAVTEMYQDAFVGSSIENGTTMITFDLRQHEFQQEVGAAATLAWRKEAYHVDIHELSTFHNPIKYRFILAQGSYLDDQNQRRYFTPAIRRIDSTAYEPQHYPLGVLSGGGVRRQSQAHCAPLFRAVLDSYYQIVDQEMD